MDIAAASMIRAMFSNGLIAMGFSAG